ncbi:hypothetical protein ACWD6P_14530 [Streptomyces sp. NPDC002446]
MTDGVTPRDGSVPRQASSRGNVDVPHRPAENRAEAVGKLRQRQRLRPADLYLADDWTLRQQLGDRDLRDIPHVHMSPSARPGRIGQHAPADRGGCREGVLQEAVGPQHGQ